MKRKMWYEIIPWAKLHSLQKIGINFHYVLCVCLIGRKRTPQRRAFQIFDFYRKPSKIRKWLKKMGFLIWWKEWHQIFLNGGEKNNGKKGREREREWAKHLFVSTEITQSIDRCIQRIILKFQTRSIPLHFALITWFVWSC